MKARFNFFMKSIWLIVALLIHGQTTASAGQTWANKHKTAHPAGRQKPDLQKISRQLTEKASPYLRGQAAAPTAPSALSNLTAQGVTGALVSREQFDLSRRFPNCQIEVHESNGTPIFLSGDGLAQASEVRSPASDPEIALTFLDDNKDIFKLIAPRQELQLTSQNEDETGRRHLRFAQFHQGIPIWGKDLAVHIDRDNRIYCFNGRYAPTPALDILTPSISAPQAVTLVEADMQQVMPITVFDAMLQKILDYTAPKATQYIYFDAHNPARLIWHVEIRPNLRDRWFYFVDAGSGAILEKYNATASDGPVTGTARDLYGINRSINVYQAGSAYYMIDGSRPIWQQSQPNVLDDPKGALWTISANNTDLGANARLTHVTSSNSNSWEAGAVSGHYNVGEVFNYYYSKFGRRGIDNKGSTIISIMHVTENGRGMDNAYWNGVAMAYGDGNQAFEPLAKALDVAAHEMTHGVIELTAGLEYKNQSGALNESLADVFGAMVDADDWYIGEDVTKTSYISTGRLRDMANPHNGNGNGWQPAHMNEFRNMSINDDNGGVHVNSGIPNRACYLIGNAIGRAKTEQIYYRVLSSGYLNKQSNFADMRNAAVQASTDLYGASSTETNAVKAGFDGVGILGSGGSTEPTDTPPIQNAVEWIACLEVGSQYLYVVNPINRVPLQISDVPVLRESANPVSVTDDGSYALYVDYQNNLRGVDLTTGVDEALDDSGQWWSIAISPDGRKIAATTNSDYDPKIYIWIADANGDFSDVPVEVDLYNPTSQDNIFDDTVQYADALDWDLSSSFLVYDAFNRVDQSDGGSLDFWAVYLMDVEATVDDLNDWPVIYSIFPPLPEGLSVGNPSFAQTNDSYLVYDFVDFNAEQSQIWAVDLYSGDEGMLFNSGDFYQSGSDLIANPGYAKYSPNDRELVFQWYDHVTSNSMLIGRVPTTDRLNPSGQATAFLQGAMLPVWYAVGKRQLPIGVEDDPVADSQNRLELRNYPNPFAPATTVRYQLPVAGEISLAVYDVAGRQVAELAKGYHAAGAYEARWDATTDKLAAGVYLGKLTLRGETGQSYEYIRKMVFVR